MRTLSILGSTSILLAAAIGGGCARTTALTRTASSGTTDPHAEVSVARVGESRTGAAVVLATIDGRQIAIAADDDDATLHAVDLTTQREISTTTLDGTPAQILLAKDGRLFVAMRDRAEVAVLKVTSHDGAMKKIASMSTPTEPVGLALTPDDATLVVTSGWGHQVTAFSVAANVAKFHADLPREPRAIVVSDDGAHAFVSHAVGSKMSVVDLVEPTHTVRVVDLDEREKPAEGVQDQSTKRTSCQGFALAKSVAPAGRIFAPQVLVDSGDTSQQASGYGSDAQPTEVGSIAVVDDADAKPIAASLSPIRAIARTAANSTMGPMGVSTPGPECLLPRAAATNGSSLYVACLGSDRIYEYDATAADPHAAERRSWRVASGPMGIAIDAKSARAIVWSQFDRAITVLSLAEPVVGMPPSSEPLAHIALSRKATVATQGDVALGRKLFHAAGDSRISSDGRACASCHPDGRDDAITWATPTGPRQTPMLAGRVADTAPLGWDGAGKDIPQHLTHTFERLRGAGLAKEEVSALAAYLRTMKAPIAAKTAQVDPLVAKGKDIFNSAETACATCHSEGDKTTDGTNHLVGTVNAADTAEAFNTPSLRFVGGTAPYFHDGRFATLRELLVASDGKMGHTKQLGPAELEALEAYLRSL